MVLPTKKYRSPDLALKVFLFDSARSHKLLLFKGNVSKRYLAKTKTKFANTWEVELFINVPFPHP